MHTEHDHLTTLIELMAQAESETELEAYRWLGTRSRRPLVSTQKGCMWWICEGHPTTVNWVTRKGNSMTTSFRCRWAAAVLPEALFRRLKTERKTSTFPRVASFGPKPYEMWFGRNHLRAAYQAVARAWYRSHRHRAVLDAWTPPDARPLAEECHDDTV